jgi:hypothetical protein
MQAPTFAKPLQRVSVILAHDIKIYPGSTTYWGQYLRLTYIVPVISTDNTPI